MHRLAAAAALVALLLPAFAPSTATAETKRAREKRCAEQAVLVGKAIEMRRAESTQAQVLEALADEASRKVVRTVPILVGYVFSLPDEALSDEIPAAFAEQCASFEN